MGILENQARLTMDIDLDRLSIVKLLCYSRQASRSIHRAHGGDWSAFRHYFHSGRIEPVRRLLDELDGCLPDGLHDSRAPRRQDIGQRLPRIGLFRALLGRWVAQGRASWSFRFDEVIFMAGSLRRFLDMLNLAQKPDSDALIALRMDLTMADSIIEARCHGLPELAVRVEHFDQTEWLQLDRVEDIIGQAERRRPLRKTA